MPAGGGTSPSHGATAEGVGAILSALATAIKVTFGAWNYEMFGEETFPDPIERFPDYNNLNIQISKYPHRTLF